jgi:hypothetical protein
MLQKDDKQKLLCLWVLVGVFVLSRIIFLLFVYPNFFWTEDVYRGALANEIISGKLNRPIFDYQVDNYSGGSLVVGFLAVPFFLFLGPSIFALKLVGVSFFTASLIVWFLFCLGFFNFKTAIFFSLLFIFSPVFFTEMSVTTMGFHSESILFTAVTIFIFYKIFFEKAEKVRLFFALGLTSGLGVWFTYIFSLTLFSLIFTWFCFDKKFFFKKGFWIFSLGFILGFIPWISYNFTHRFQGLFIQSTELHKFFSMRNLFGVFNFKDSFVYFILKSLQLRNFGIFKIRLFLVIYSLVLFISFLSTIKRIRKKPLISKELFFIVYCVVFGIAFQSAIMHELRYITPLYPFIFIIIALFLSRLFESVNKLKKAGSITIASFLVLVNTGSNINAVFTKYAGFSLKAKGCSYYELGIREVSKFSDCSSSISQYFSLSGKVNPVYLDDYNRGFFDEIGFKLREKVNIQDISLLVNFAKNVDERYRRYPYMAISGAIFETFKKGEINKTKELISQIEPRYRYYAYMELTDNMIFNYVNKSNMIELMGEEFLPFFYQGLGEWAGMKFNKVLNSVDKRYLPFFFEGVGENIAYLFLNFENKIDIKRLIASIDKRYHPFVCKGIGQCMASYVREDSANLIICDRVINELPVFCQKYSLECFRQQQNKP